MKVCKYNSLKLQLNLYYAAVTLGYLSFNKYRYDQAKSKSSKGDGNMEVVITRLRVMFQENEKLLQATHKTYSVQMIWYLFTEKKKEMVGT